MTMRAFRGSCVALAVMVVAAAVARPAHAGQTTPPAAPAQGAATAPGTPASTVRVFLDCYQCDEEYMRQNVDFVEYMRDRETADLHVLVTTQGTGSGGTAWTMKVNGLKRFQGQDRTFTFTTAQSATSD